MPELQTTQDYLALELATVHARSVGMEFRELLAWTEEHWPDFLDEAADPRKQEDYRQRAAAELEDFDQFAAYSTLLAGPAPPACAPLDDHLAWMDRLEKAERRLERRFRRTQK